LPLAIDPHPFCDDDGQWYLFYARDFLDSEVACAGTALMVDRLQGMTKLAGKGKSSCALAGIGSGFKRTALCTMESMIGTLEGPSVRQHAGRYYCFYSGGRWETENYGVIMELQIAYWGPTPTRATRRDRACCAPFPVVFWVPVTTVSFSARMVRPSTFYHAWDTNMEAADVLGQTHLDADGPRCSGPTWTPQPIVTILVETE